MRGGFSPILDIWGGELISIFVFGCWSVVVVVGRGG